MSSQGSVSEGAGPYNIVFDGCSISLAKLCWDRAADLCGHSFSVSLRPQGSF